MTRSESGRLCWVSVEQTGHMDDPMPSARSRTSTLECTPHANCHRIFDWIETTAGCENTVVSAEEVARSYGVRESVLLHNLEQEIQDEDDVKGLPWAVLLLLFFAGMNGYHEKMSKQFSMEWAIDADIEENANFAFSSPGYMGHKGYKDVNSYADFWSWMNLGFLPLTGTSDGNYTMSEQSDTVLGEMPLDRQRHFLGHNFKIGPIRVAREQVNFTECRHRLMAETYNLTCTAFGAPDLELHPEESVITNSPLLVDTPFTVWLQGSGNESQAKLEEMEREDWLNQQTWRVQVSFLLYNGGQDMLSMTHVNFLFARSGRIWKEVTHWTMVLNPYKFWQDFVWDALFYGHVTFLMLCEIKEIFVAVASDRAHPVKALRHYANVWNFIDWLMIATSYVILGFWLMRVEKVLVLERLILDVQAEAHTCQHDCGSHWGTLFASVEEAGQAVRRAATWAAFCPLVILVRLFKAFKAQPRLASVTETLKGASGSLMHFLIVFLAIFGSYSVMGIALFGRDYREFAAFKYATATLFRCMVGDFDFEAMEVAGRTFAYFFFSTFMLLVVMVMFSMLIAIIMDVYMKIKKKLETAITLWDTIRNMAMRKYLTMRGRMVEREHVRSNLQKAVIPGRDPVVMAQDLLERVPDLREEQALLMLCAAARRYQREETPMVDGVELDEVKERLDEVVAQLVEAEKILDNNLGEEVIGMRPQAEKLAKGLRLADLLQAAEVRLEALDAPGQGQAEDIDTLQRAVATAKVLHLGVQNPFYV